MKIYEALQQSNMNDNDNLGGGGNFNRDDLDFFRKDDDGATKDVQSAMGGASVDNLGSP